MNHRSRLIWGLLIIVGLIIGLIVGPVVWAEMIVKTKDGKTYRLPLNSDELESIRFVDQTTARRPGPAPPQAAPPQAAPPQTAPPKPPPAPGPGLGPAKRPKGNIVVDVWNKGGCSFTDRSDFVLRQRMPIYDLIFLG